MSSTAMFEETLEVLVGGEADEEEYEGQEQDQEEDEEDD
jgi:hypothetical protein